MEDDFDRLPNGRGLAVRSEGRLETPGLHGCHGVLIEAEAEALHDFGVDHAAIRADNGGNKHGPLIFGLYGFVRELRIGAIEATRRAISPNTRRRIAAACAILKAISKAAAVPIADSGAFSIAHGIAQNVRERVSPCRCVDVRRRKVGISQYCRRHGNFGMLHWMGNRHSDLLLCEFGCTSAGSRSQVARAASTACL